MLDPVSRRLDRPGVAHVQSEGSASAIAGGPGRDLRRPAPIDVDNNDAGTARGKPRGAGLADAAGAARDNGNFVCQRAVHAPRASSDTAPRSAAALPGRTSAGAGTT